MYYTALSATESDILRWRSEGRSDILEWVGIVGDPPSHGGYDLWINPITGREGRCPWLKKLPNGDRYICRIYDTRPEECKNFPVHKEQMKHPDFSCRGAIDVGTNNSQKGVGRAP